MDVSFEGSFWMSPFTAGLVEVKSYQLWRFDAGKKGGVHLISHFRKKHYFSFHNLFMNFRKVGIEMKSSLV